MRRCTWVLFTWIMAIVIGGCDNRSSPAEPLNPSRDLDFVLPFEAGRPSPNQPAPRTAMLSAAVNSLDNCDTQIIKDPECYNEPERELTDREIANLWPSEIVDMGSQGSVTHDRAIGSGWTDYIGTRGEMKTEVQFYYLDEYMQSRYDDDCQHRVKVAQTHRTKMAHFGGGDEPQGVGASRRLLRLG